MSAPERIPAQPGMTPDQQEETGKILAHGRLTVLGRIPGASNTVLYATAELGGRTVPCVCKPVAGERPLWDFPEGNLARREVAAYEVCRALGWDLVPPTVLREGPGGETMCQLWVGPDPLAGDPEPAGEGEGRGTPARRPANCWRSPRAPRLAPAGAPSARWRRPTARPPCWCTPTIRGCAGSPSWTR